jgi:hypothetical protein
MRTRSLPAGAAIALVFGLLTAGPAVAAYTVDSITFPGGGSEFYSPFSGPASITFSFEGTENDATFNLRIRPAGGSPVHTENVFVDADDPAGSQIETFNWPALSVNAPRTYVVAVYRNDVQLANESFQLNPPLATITGIAPNPFFPLMDNNHKDNTTVSFRLLEAAEAEARVFRARSNGNCCGILVRNEMVDPGQSPSGANAWVWDGRNNSNNEAGVGQYFVKIKADDGTNAPATSKPKKVSIARTYRTTDTRSKEGTAYHHTTESALVRGGDCFLHNQGGFLQVDCHGAKMTVFYRWGLGSAQRIEKASFVIDDPNNDCSPAQRNPGHSKHESFLTVTDSVSGITSCHIVTAKITYSYLKAS